jgi:hypothetical protein
LKPVTADYVTKKNHGWKFQVKYEKSLQEASTTFAETCELNEAFFVVSIQRRQPPETFLWSKKYFVSWLIHD